MKKVILCLLVFLSLIIGVQTSFAKVEKVGKDRIVIYNEVTMGDEIDLKKIFLDNSYVQNWIIEINSPGGMVFVGVDMYNEIKEQIEKGKHITTIIKGEADSMGGILFLAGQRRIIYEGAQFMVHKAFLTNKFGVKVTPPPGSDGEKSLKITNDFFIDVFKKFYNDDEIKVDSLLEKSLRLTAKEVFEKGIATDYIDLTK
jgi:ATP-dependent protease ClpP protease subunit